MQKTRRWARLRAVVLRRDGYRCRACGSAGRMEVDHVEPVRDAPELAFDENNLQALCGTCHTRKTRTECGHPPPLPPVPGRDQWHAALLNVPRTL